MADARASVRINTDKDRSYELEVGFDGNAGLLPVVSGLKITFRCPNDHSRNALLGILKRAVQELDEVGKVGR